jgi:hypothetical protein
MRIIFGCLVALAAAFAATPAAAQVYPWCAQYSQEGGSTNCGFSSLQQCQWAISGNGGYCEQNPFYTAPQSAPRPRQRKQRG